MPVSETRLDNWMRGNPGEAQKVLVDLVYYLVMAAVPNPTICRFPRGDSTNQSGEDGDVDVEQGRLPFVPDGASKWEMGAGKDPASKATEDYSSRTAKVNAETRRKAAFVFVTPLSGLTAWPKDKQQEWIDRRKKENAWADVRVIDGSSLAQWLELYPAVDDWLESIMIGSVDTPISLGVHWSQLRRIGHPPNFLRPHVFLSNREAAAAKLQQALDGNLPRLELDTRYKLGVVDFVAAYLANLDEKTRSKYAGRCVYAPSLEAWKAMLRLPNPHLIVAGHKVELDGPDGPMMLGNARERKHTIVFGRSPGGIQHESRISLSESTVPNLARALQESEYPEERARIVAKRSDGILDAMKRILSDVSVIPEWATVPQGADLRVAGFLGGWIDGSEADRGIAEVLSGKAYGEWIKVVRTIEKLPAAPLVQREGKWRVTGRYEVWLALGPHVFDDDLQRLEDAAVKVLGELDPALDLESDQRFMAGVLGKKLGHSALLRAGMANTVALLGSIPEALTSCSNGKAEQTAGRVVRRILQDAPWQVWASLDSLLPALAEAAPDEFLTAVEVCSEKADSPFKQLFLEEGKGIFGRTYMAGFLWALEDLAWSPDLLTRTTRVLGKLAALDPGGNWSNRPANSLTTIYLPWLPQSSASPKGRKKGLQALLGAEPKTGWQVLLSLLPEAHGVSSGTHRPAWRAFIPDDWPSRPPADEHIEAVQDVVDLALAASSSNPERAQELVAHYDGLPDAAQTAFESALVKMESLPELTRYPVWNAVSDLAARHKRFADANWAMPEEKRRRLDILAARLAPNAPSIKHRRLFDSASHDLFDHEGDYQAQEAALESRRREAVEDVERDGGLAGVLAFATEVESPARVGWSFGQGSKQDSEPAFLRTWLLTTDKALRQFVAGFVSGRYFSRGWPWVDQLVTDGWTPKAKAEFLSFLPFSYDAWERARTWLGEEEHLYWRVADVHPHTDLEHAEIAIEHLLKVNRGKRALQCVAAREKKHGSLDAELVFQALLAAATTDEAQGQLDSYHFTEVLAAFQTRDDVDSAKVQQVEWLYLPALGGVREGRPLHLERRLAQDPVMFCELISTVFKSINETAASPSPRAEKHVAERAYHLLQVWKIPPGTDAVGTLVAAECTGWIAETKRLARETGHLEIALSFIGKVLIHAAPDQDLWIDLHVAKILDSPDHDEMREGFCTALFNARGAHGFSSGKAERSIAKRYFDQAQACEDQQLHRLANSLRGLAKSYERDAKHAETHDPFDDFA